MYGISKYVITFAPHSFILHHKTTKHSLKILCSVCARSRFHTEQTFVEKLMVQINRKALALHVICSLRPQVSSAVNTRT